MKNANKAVVLARGLGTRMRRADANAALAAEQAAAADAGMKAMIPVGRPFLDYVVSGLADAGFLDVCLVVGPEHGGIRDHYTPAPQRIAIHYAIQKEALGTANAVLAARAFAAEDEFVVMNGDNLYPIQALQTLRATGDPGTVLFDRDGLMRNSNIPPERLDSFAYAEVHEGMLVRVVEKPAPGTRIPRDALVSMNVWRFGPEIFEHCRDVERSERNEYELPAAVNRAVRHGLRLRVLRSDLGVLDLSQRRDIPEVTRRLRGIEVVL